GRSEEHEVSLSSARSVLEAVGGSDRLEVVPLVIGRDGAVLGPAESARLLGVTPAGELAGDAGGGAAPGLAGTPAGPRGQPAAEGHRGSAGRSEERRVGKECRSRRWPGAYEPTEQVETHQCHEGRA